MPSKIQRTWLANRLWLDMLGRMTPAAVGGQNAAGLPPPTLKFVRLAGTQLTMQWEPVAGSAHYEIYRNTVPSADGAALVMATSNTLVQFPFNVSTGEIIEEGRGFESGDFSGWTLADLSNSAWSVSQVDKHSGGYAAYADADIDTGTSSFVGKKYRIAPSQSYTFSFWHKVTAVNAGAGTNPSIAVWLVQIRTSGVSYTGVSPLAVDAVDVEWAQSSGTFTSEADAEYAYLAVYANLGTGPTSSITGYVDDFSLSGPSPRTPETDLFAVCAVDKGGNVSPLSNWIEPQVVPSALGSTAADHSLLDPANAAIQSSNFVAGSAGYKLSPEGIDGLLLSGGGSETGDLKWVPYRAIPTGWLRPDGAAVSRSTYASLFAVLCANLGAATMTIASPCVVTLAGHGFIAGDSFYFTTSGALPTGVSANTLYYVIVTGLTADTFRFAATRGGAAINSSGSQSGAHAIHACPWGLGDGSTTFNLPDLLGRTPVGAGSVLTLGLTDGVAEASRSPLHTHSVPRDGWGYTQTAGVAGRITTNQASISQQMATGNNTSGSGGPSYAVLWPLIKT